jgi:hypothetical protein
LRGKEVELIDIDGTGIYPALRLLRRNFKLKYYSMTGDRSITRLVERCLGPAHVRLVADSINKNRLIQSSRYLEAGSTGVLLISYLSEFSRDFRDTDVLRLAQKIAKNLPEEASFIVTGITYPGFMDRLVESIKKEIALEKLDGQSILYIPSPLFMGSRVPVGGRLTEKSGQVVRAIVGRKRIVNGLSLLEAEVSSIVMLIRGALMEIAAVQGLLLSRKLSVPPMTVLRSSLGRGVKLSLIARRDHPVLRMINRVESNLLMGRGITRVLLRMSRAAEADFANLLSRLRKGRERLRILVIGSELKMLSEFSSRRAVVYHIPRMAPDMLEEKVKTYAGKCDVVLLTSRDKHASRIVKTSLGEDVVIINLYDYVGMGE